MGTGVGKAISCHPEAVSLAKVTLASNVPPVSPQTSHVRAGIRCRLIEPQSRDVPVDIALELDPQLHCTRIRIGQNRRDKRIIPEGTCECPGMQEKQEK